MVFTGAARVSDGQWFRGNQLYVPALLISTYGKVNRLELYDHGMQSDGQANDSWYINGYFFDQEDRPGVWYLIVFAQDVNTFLEGTTPFDAAPTIGGTLLTTQFS